jgi:hypothetical protein
MGETRSFYMKKNTTKVILSAIAVIIIICVIQGIGYATDQYNDVTEKQMKEKSEIKFQPTENKTADIVGCWQGVYQKEPNLHMIFTETAYKILQEKGNDVNAYPVLEKGTWTIKGDQLHLTADTIVDGVKTQIMRTYFIQLEKSLEQTENFRVLKIYDDDLTYFYGRKVQDKNQLVGINWNQPNEARE